MAFTSASQLAVTSAGVRLRMTRISGSAPARAKALAVSYSQLVPGKTGMMHLRLCDADLGRGCGSRLACRRWVLRWPRPWCGRGTPAPAWPPRSPAARPYPSSHRSTRRCTPWWSRPAAQPAGESDDHFQHDGAVHGREHLGGGLVGHHLEADAVAQTHLEQGLGQAAVAHGTGRRHHALWSIICSTIL